MKLRQMILKEKNQILFINKMIYTAFNIVYDNWFEANNLQKLPIQRKILRQDFSMECLLGVENTLRIRSRQAMYYTIKTKLNLKFIKASNIADMKQHSEIFLKENFMQMKEDY